MTTSDSQTRTYRGSSVDELIPRIQRELGDDAIILRRREGLTGGVLGFFQRSFVEIDAVAGHPRVDLYDEEPSALPGAPVAEEGHALGAYVSEQLAALASVGPAPALPVAPSRAHGVNAPTEFRELPAAFAPTYESSAPPPDPHSPERPGTASSAPFTEMPVAPAREPSSGRPLDSFAAALASAESESPPPQPQRPHATRFSPPPEPWTVPAPERGPARAGAGIEKRLLAVGVSPGFARELIEGASAHVLPLAPGGGLKRGVRAALAQRIPVAPALPVRGAAIVVVGAGGSGKTSYCAALMRAYRRNAVLPARCATLSWSPERAGLHVMLTPHVMWPTPLSAPRAQRALRRVRGEGLLVIDTPRMSPADKAGIRELARLLGELAPERVVVALPATLGAAAAAQLLQALAPLGSNALAVTHTEETDQEGVAVEVACKFGLAPEYRLDRNRAGVWRVGLTDPNTLATRLLP